MYDSPEAVTAYAKKMNLPEDLLKESIARFQPRVALQTDKMADLEGAMRDAVKLKFLDEPLSKEQLAEFIQTPPRK
jgi:NitT/TauT family transport system substrate-binding protein